MRIEDTDELRSTKESVESIFDSMRWLGLVWDEGAMPDMSEKGEFGPYVQSRREAVGIYREYAEKLIKEGFAYRCYCTPEELDESRKKALAEKRLPKYEGLCRHLAPGQAEKYEKEGRKPVIRFKMPDDGFTGWNDLIHKELKFDNKLLYDFVMLKAGGYPTYNFACVIDDHLMQISHVIRGDDHISNTPLQINLYKALGWEMPEFAHLSMILGPDGTRLSKRHGATSVQEYKKLGYLPDTVKNYLALLGWSNPESQQIFAEGELEEKFNLDGCQKSPATFDNVKLQWMNGEYIRKISREKLYEFALPYLQEAGLDLSAAKADVKDLVYMEFEKYKLLSDIPGRLEMFFKEEPAYDPKAMEDVLKKPETDKILSGIAAAYRELPDFSEKSIEEATRVFAKANGYKNGQVFHPVRVAVSGRAQGPTLFKMIEYLSRETAVKRINKTLDMIRTANGEKSK